MTVPSYSPPPDPAPRWGPSVDKELSTGFDPRLLRARMRLGEFFWGLADAGGTMGLVARRQPPLVTFAQMREMFLFHMGSGCG